MAERAEKRTAAEIIIRIITAAVIISGIFTIGAMNLFCTDSLYVDYTAHFTGQSVIRGAIILISAAAVMVGLYLLAGTGHGIAVLLCIGAAARLAAVFLWKIDPESDFLITYDLGKLLAQTPILSWGTVLEDCGTSYNDIWSAHMPFIVYQSILLRICSDAVILRIANAVFSWGTLYFIVDIAGRLGGRNARKAAAAFTVLNPVIVFFIPVLTNQHISQFFFILAAWVFLCAPVKNIHIRALLAGLCAGMSQLMRPELAPALIALTAGVIYSALKYKNAAVKLTVYALFISMLLAVIVSANTFLTSAHAVKRSIYSGNLNYKIMVGLNRETGGSWSEADSRLEGNDAAINAVIRKRLEKPWELIGVMYGKAVYQSGSYVYTWSYRSDAEWISQNIMRRSGAAVMLLACALAAWHILRSRGRVTLWMYGILASYMLTFAVIEIQARYNFIFLPVILIGAAVNKEKMR